MEKMEAHGDITTNVIIMIVASIIITYYLTMTILLSQNKTDNRNKMYQALLMGFWMGLVELLMIAYFTHTWNCTFTIFFSILIVGIIVFTIFIRNQSYINENQFMLSMIEHHQMAIEMAQKVQPKITEPELHNITQNIIISQEQEINQMKNILRKRGVPGNITSLFS